MIDSLTVFALLAFLVVEGAFLVAAAFLVVLDFFFAEGTFFVAVAFLVAGFAASVAFLVVVVDEDAGVVFFVLRVFFGLIASPLVARVGENGNGAVPSRAAL